MTEFDPLREELRKLVRLLKQHGIRLIVGGGYGLLLKTEHVQRAGVRTRFQEIPGARATNDLDIFLSAEIISDADKTEQIRAALDELRYKPVEGAEFFQFILPIKYAGLNQEVKIDLLAAPPQGEEAANVRMDAVRIRPRKRTAHKLHAHTTREAITLEEHLFEYDLGGDESEPLVVYLPHPFSYIILKLFALRDRVDDELKGPYHAFDLYRVIAMMTEEEWEQSEKLRDSLTGSTILTGAREIVGELFASTASEGVRLIFSHARSVREDIPDEQLREFIEDLHELLQL